MQRSLKKRPDSSNRYLLPGAEVIWPVMVGKVLEVGGVDSKNGLEHTALEELFVLQMCPDTVPGAAEIETFVDLIASTFR